MVKKVFGDNVQEEQMETSLETPIVGVETPMQKGVEPRVKQMIRWISGGVNETGDSVFTVDDELSGYLAKGYRLFATHYIGSDPTNGIGVLYVLVLQ